MDTRCAGDGLLTGVVRCSNGWIHTLLEEAENERMHLLTFLTLKEKNNLIFRSMVIGGQVCTPPGSHAQPGCKSTQENFFSSYRALSASWLWYV